MVEEGHPSVAEQIMQEIKDERKDYPTCKQCGGHMIHSRIYGYYCAVNREHQGIVWPSHAPMAQAEERLKAKPK